MTENVTKMKKPDLVQLNNIQKSQIEQLMKKNEKLEELTEKQEKFIEKSKKAARVLRAKMDCYKAQFITSNDNHIHLKVTTDIENEKES